MNKAMSTGARVATWTVAGLLVLGASAGVASAVTSNHHTTSGSGSGSSGHPGYGFGFGGYGAPGGAGAPTGEGGSSSGSRPSFPGGGHGPGGFGGGFGGGRGLVHGEETLKVNGKYQVVDQQSGTVTTVSATSITVTSTDKYAATYVINSDTKIFSSGKTIAASALKSGETVFVNGTKSGATITATTIAEGTFPTGPGGGGWRGGHPGPAPSGAPSGAPTTSPSGAPTA